MKILMASGGSGGHIYPSLALANGLKDKYTVEFIGYKGKMENKIIPNNNYVFHGIDKSKHKYFGLYSEYKKIKNKIKEVDPDLVIGWGNSLSFLAVLAAHRLGVKTIIHEQNIIPGKANKLASRFVDDVVISYDETNKYFKKCLCLGNPRGEESANNINNVYVLDKNKKNVLIVMGSLGSSSVYKFMIDLLNTVKIDAHFIVVIGKNVRNDLKINNTNDVSVYDYIESMPSLLKEVDLIISRAGATTLSEIEALNVVSILIPSPYVTNNHQYLNAKALVDKNLAMMIEEKDLDKGKVKDMIMDSSKHMSIKMNLYKNRKKKGITDFVKLIDDKYKK